MTSFTLCSGSVRDVVELYTRTLAPTPDYENTYYAFDILNLLDDNSRDDQNS